MVFLPAKLDVEMLLEQPNGTAPEAKRCVLQKPVQPSSIQLT